MHVYLDMDEVLSDFVGGLLDLMNVNRGLFNQYRTRGRRNVFDDLNEHFDYSYSYSQWWGFIYAAGESFWKDLKILPAANGVIGMVSSFDPKFCIVSSPARSGDCYKGKFNWIRNTLGERFLAEDRFILTPQKWRLAKQGCVLVDDCPKQVAKFKENGGDAILYPTLGADDEIVRSYVGRELVYIKNRLQGVQYALNV